MTTDNTPAFYSRWLIVIFSNVFKYGIDADPYLIEKLTTNNELSGILNWAIDGLYQLRYNGNFTYNKNANEIRDLWNSLNTGINGFLQNYTDKTIHGLVPKKKLYSIYEQYCINNQISLISYGKFCSQIKNISYISETRPTINASRVQCFKGIKLRQVSQG